MSATTRGPLGQIQYKTREEGVLGRTAPPAEPGRNYSVGLAFGDRRMTVGVRVHGNNMSSEMLDPARGAQYISGAAAVDMRYSVVELGGVSAVAMLAPSTTALFDSLSGDVTYGAGMRVGGGLAYRLKAFSVYADAYRETLMFQDGPAAGNSTRSGVTVGVAFQP